MIETPWQIQLLGGLSARRAPHVISRFQTYKTGALLAYLAYHAPQVFSREVLIELLWPEAAPAAGRNSLSVALSALRRRLEPPGTPAGIVLQATRSHVSLAATAVQTDVAEYRAALRRAATASDEASEAGLLGEAVSHYPGDLLPDCYEDWVGAEREHLKDMYLDALRRLIRHHSSQRATNTAIEYAHRAIRADPLRESSHRTLMRLYAASGRPAASLDHFRVMEQLLKQALDAAPARASRELAQEIAEKIGGSDAASHPPVAPDARDVSGAPAVSDAPEAIGRQREAAGEEPPQAWGQFPLPLTRFFGGVEDREQGQRLLSDPAVRLLTLTGLGGVGKTRLAVEIGAGLRSIFSGGICFVPLADVTDPEWIVDSILAAVGRAPEPGVAAWDQVVTTLSGQRRLLILDNFEHLVEQGGPIIHKLLTHVPTLACLVTSRECLNVSGEQVRSVAPLPLPQTDAPLEEIAGTPSVQLFVDRVQARRVDFQITRANAQTVAALCRALEGLPLALELAAAWGRVLTPSQMLARLQRRFELLQGRARDLPVRHQSLWAVLDSSYGFLPRELQQLFASLSIFRDGWDLEAAAAVHANVEEEAMLDHLRRLQEKSLILAAEVNGAMRGRMLDTVREYAARQLTPDTATHLAERHFTYFAALARTAHEHLTGTDQIGWMNRLAADLENLRAALAWGAAERPEDALHLAADIARFWWVRGHAAEGLAFLESTTAAAGSALSGKCRLRVLAAQGDLTHRLGDFPRARALFEQALAQCRAEENVAGEAETLGSLGELLMNEGDYAEARACLGRAHFFHAQLGQMDGYKATLSALGYVAREMGDYTAARAFLEQAIAVSEARQDSLTAAADRGSLAHVLLAQGDLTGAGGLLRRTLGDYRALGNLPGQAWALASLAQIVLEQGALPAAKTFLEEALAINRQVGSRAGETWNLDSLGVILLDLGNVGGARDLLEQALTISREIGGRSLEAWILCHLGDVENTRGERAAARSHYEAAVRLMRALGMQGGFSGPLEAMAGIWASAGEAVRGAGILGAADSLRRAAGAPLPPITLPKHERVIETVRAALEEAAYARAFAWGGSLTPLQAVAYALGEEDTPDG